MGQTREDKVLKLLTNKQDSPTENSLVLPNYSVAAGANKINARFASVTTDSLSMSSPLPVASGGTGSSTAADARTALGLAIGTNVQAYDSDLTTWAGITPGTGVGTFLATPSSSNLASAVTDETGSGALVFGTTPTISGATMVNPALGTPVSGNLSNCTSLSAAAIVAGSFVANMEASDHGTAATDMLVNVCYGTGAAPAANTTTEGTLYITYTA